jgi:hypothetical protein
MADPGRVVAALAGAEGKAMMLPGMFKFIVWSMEVSPAMVVTRGRGVVEPDTQGLADAERM